jgi:hypothetical protein
MNGTSITDLIQPFDSALQLFDQGVVVITGVTGSCNLEAGRGVQH